MRLQSCLSWRETLPDSENVVASSVKIVPFSDRAHAILATTANGDAVMWVVTENGDISTRHTLANSAQISCVTAEDDALRVAFVERDASALEYRFFVRTFDQNGMPLNDVWNAKTRHFSPDPDASCGFLGKRSLLVTGSRPRGNDAPYHGLFKIEPRLLQFFEQSQPHTPVVESVDASTKTVILREIIKTTGGKNQWRATQYLVSDDARLLTEIHSDILLKSGKNTFQISYDGCVQFNNAEICIQNPVSEILSYYQENSSLIFIFNDGAQRKIARISKTDNASNVAALDQKIRLYSLKLRDGSRLYQIENDTYPDRGERLGFVNYDENCIFR